MAKIAETIFIVKASKLVADSDSTTEVLDGETVLQLEEIIKELSGGAMVEIEHVKSGD